LVVYCEGFTAHISIGIGYYFFIGCVSTQVDVVEESKAPVDWIVDVKQSVADPFHWRFTLFINEEEVLETLSFSEKISKTKYQGHEISMDADFKIKFFRTTWIVIVNVDDVPTYKNVFHNLTLF
jgi:hypothetical protein